MEAIPVSAQLYRHLNTSHGLNSHRVIAIEKDQKGYMWFLTQEGVDRYNGKQFSFYPLMDGNRTLQHFPYSNWLYIDEKDDIWVTGKNGYIFKYNRMKDKYDLIMNFADSLHTTRRLPLTFVGMDRNNHLWLCTRNGQYIYHTQNGKTIQLDSPIKEEITYIEQGKGNHYFIGTSQRIFQAYLKGNKLTIDPHTAIENIHRIQHIHYHIHTDKLLIGTMADGFYIFDLGTHTLSNIGSLKDVTMNAAIDAHSSKEEVIIATDGNGMYRLNMQTCQLTSYLNDAQTPHKMNGNIIKDIHHDEEGRLWMAVYPIGITIHSDKYPKYELLIPPYTNNKQASASHQVTNVVEDSDGDIWMATTDGISCYHTHSRQWTTLLSSHQHDKQERNHVYISLCEAMPGVILVGGYMSGMFRINKQDMRPQYFSPKAEGESNIRPDKYIRSIYKDTQGSVWAGGYYNFKNINPETGKTEHYSTDYPITVITEKNEKELWVGTVNGIYKFNKEQKKLQQVHLSSEIGTVNSILQTDNAMTYIGTHGTGLWIYNNKTGKLENHHTKNSALMSNNIFCILPSTHPNKLIISTENELVSFDIHQHTFRSWTQEQGLPTDKFSTSAGIRTQKGKLLFGSDKGLIVIKDSINLPDSFYSKLVFSNLNIHYQQMLPGTNGSPLDVPIDETDKITLSHTQNIFSIEVSSINYECPSRILYSWKLEGFYDKWTTPSETNVIRYTNLAPGDYTLKVRAVLLDDEHILEERKLHIHINPPFTHTIWAFLIYTIIVLLMVSAILRYVWMRKNSVLSREKIQFFINTAHDIRTPLTLIKGPLSEISRTEKLSEKGKNNLENAIQNTNRLSELATKLIEFQKEGLHATDIQTNRCELNIYIRECMKPFEGYAQKKNLQLIFEGTPNALEAWIDKNKMDSIIHNLLSNAMKYTPEGGKITITLQQKQAAEWTLTISDTGIGIPASDQKKIFKHLFRGENAVNLRITGTGIGMLQTYRLTQRHLGKITIASKEHEGTTFYLRFPIDHKKFIHLSHEIVSNQENKESFFSQEKTPVIVQTKDSQAKEILIVEDNPELRHFLSQSLSESYRIKEAENGQEALQLITQQQPDLIISDIMMPIMRGDELCKNLKENIETSHIPVILLTALGDRESILHGLKLKADSYVVKPFDMEILKANIASVLANKELVRHRFAQLNYRTEDLPQEIKQVSGLNLDQEFLIKATDFVKKNLDQEFNVDDLCQEMGMSRSSLYNKIKALTDRSPSDFIRQIRMKEAAILLKSKKYTISEVSDMMGYSDPKYFTDIFKKHYGMTPSAYMKQA